MLLDTVLDALRSVASNKVRSFLTMLSIGIGVFGVIVLMSVAAGAARSTEEQVGQLGSPRLITVYSNYSPGSGAVFYDPGAGAAGGDGGFAAGEGPDAFDSFDPAAVPVQAPAPQPLTSQDLARLNDEAVAPDIEGAAATHQYCTNVVGESGATSQYDTCQIFGTVPEYLAIGRFTMREGTFITAADVRNRARVVTLGAPMADEIGATVGGNVVINGISFEVVGITEAEPFDFSGAAFTYMPETTIQDTLMGPQDGYTQVLALAADGSDVEVAAQQVRDVLREAHDLGPTDQLDAEVTTRTRELASLRQITFVLQALAAAIASVSLFVGGIGVMNIMLVTVAERTREIGIRKAVGAQRGHLILQFLLEAVVLTSIGGITGMLLGTLVQYIQIQSFSPVVTPFSIALALGFSVATGVFFGLYPANRAAGLPPVQALRYE